MGNYKETLLLPKTDMPINANLPVREPPRYEQWWSGNVYNRMRTRGKNPFILHDGPPYANGNIHIGHALNKILKDFAAKFQFFNGRPVHFVPGWDCHGLPIEQKVKQGLEQGVYGGRSPDEFRQLCREYAERQIELQKEQFKALGVVADWDNPYETMDRSFETGILSRLMELAMMGLLFEREKPVYWSWAEQTALAEAEVEYKDRDDESIWVAFPVATPTFPGGVAVWTTTPWTLPANVAVALHPDLQYVAAKVQGWNYPLLMTPSGFDYLKNMGATVELVRDGFTGRDFDGWLLKHPVYEDKTVPIVMADFVTADTGTGCVHIAPGHGEDDHQVGLKYNLPVVMPVGPDGKYTEGKYSGMHVFSANEKIIDDLERSGRLLATQTFTHSYPHCWRSGTPVIFRATKQWFLDVNALREKVLQELEATEFVPESAKARMKPMVENRPDWCLSRQRSWGVPIAFFRDVDTGEALFDRDVFEIVVDILDAEGMDAWFRHPPKYFLPGSVANPDKHVKVQDILDVWFDSGLSWHILGGHQADLYLEGNDQHRGWFQSSLWLSVALKGMAPFKKIVTHGFVVDGQGEKMAKSKGNVVSPQDIVSKYGSEVLRYWVASTDYTKEIRVSNEILSRASEGHRKLRNTLRFLVANLDQEQVQSMTQSALLPVDFWILEKSQAVFEEVHKAFGNYDYCGGLHKLMEYINTDLSSIYMNAVKDRLYCDAKNSHARQSCQFTLALLLRSMLGLVAPVFTYTADEVLSYTPVWFRNKAKDIFDWEYHPLPEMERYAVSEELSLYLDESYWKKALAAFHVEFDRLKNEGKVRDTLEVFVETQGKSKFFARCEDWFVVSECHGLPVDREPLGEFEVDGDHYRIVKSHHAKCDRCWKRLANEEGLCPRCRKVVNQKV